MAKHEIVKQFERGEIDAQEALETLGEYMETAKSQGRSIGPLQAAVDAILGMKAEPAPDPAHDEEWADTYRNQGKE